MNLINQRAWPHLSIAFAFALFAALGTAAGDALAVTNGNVGIANSTLTYNAQGSKSNLLAVGATETTIELSEAGTGITALDDADGAGGCLVTGTTASCPVAALTGLVIDLGSDSDTLTIDPAVTLPAAIAGDSGRDTITGGSGDDTIDPGVASDTIDGGDGVDTVTYATRSSKVNLSIDGIDNDGQSNEHDDIGDDVENLTGGKKADTLSGDVGDNVLDGGPEADTLEGGGGDDTVSYAGRATKVTFDFDGVADDGEAGEDDVVGSDIAAVVGGSAGDQLTGSPDDESIDGGPGDDTLDGGLGSDRLVGAEGVDLVSYANRTTAVTVDEAEPDGDGEDGEDDDVAEDVESVTGGSAGDQLTAGSGAGTLTGGSGNDTLDGGPGSDTIAGGTGSDVASYGERAAGVSVSLNGVRDDGEPGEGDLVAPDVENLTGGSGDDSLTGNAAFNVVSGGEGNDRLDGAAGADVLVGGAGSDLADYSGRGVPIATTANGVADDGATGEGDLYSSDVEGANGGAANDILSGGPGDGALSGGAGDDILVADPGDDGLSGGPGTDIADYSARAEPQSISVDDAPGDGAGPDEDDNVGTDIEVVLGGSGSDSISGGDGAELLRGGAGDDDLSGGDGADQLIGESGADSFDGGDGDDAIAARDGQAEEVACGDGNDTAEADAADNVDEDCEGVSGFVAGPAILISGRAVRMDRKGLVAVKVVCVRSNRDCEGRLAIEAKSGGSSARKLKGRLGKADFSVFSDDSDTIAIKLSTAARKQVLRKHKLVVRAVATVAKTPTVTRNISVKAPKPNRGSKRHR